MSAEGNVTEYCATCGKPLKECTCKSTQKGLNVEITVKEDVEKEVKEIKDYMRERLLTKYKKEMPEKASFAELKNEIEHQQLNKDVSELQNEKNLLRGTPSGGAAGKAPLSGEYGSFGTVKRDNKGKIENWQEGEFETQEQLIEVLKEISDNEKNQYPEPEQNEAKRVLDLLIKKALANEEKEPTSMVYEGSLSDVLKGHYNPKLWKKPSAKELQEGEN